MAMLDEEKPSGNLNSKPSMKVPGLRSTRHGSFDFERPGWSVGSIARSASGGSGSTSVGTGHSKESLEHGRGVAKSRHRVDRTPPHSEPGHEPSTFQQHTRSSSTRDPPPPPESSSLGRKTGRRTLRTGIARLVGLSHGPFPFEPPVPSPTVSTVSEKSAQESLRAREARERKESDQARQREKERKRAARRTTHQAEPEPPPPPEKPNLGFRSGTKGRSLDLGLGLAWAPTKMKQEALLPSSVVFSKGLSTSSKNGFVHKVGTMEVDGDRSKIGREVAEAFRSALDDEAYITFKRYVRRFDAHDIPFDGPTGILARAEKLLDRSPNLPETHKRKLLDRLVRIILQNT